MANPVFYDPERRRWRRLRRVFDISALLLTIVFSIFLFSVVSNEKLGTLLLPEQKRQYRALKEKERAHAAKAKKTHRKTSVKPSEVELNRDEGIRAAFYVTWDAGSFSSLKEYLHQIDLLYPEWLHVLTPDGKLQGVDQANVLFDVTSGQNVHLVDDKVMPLIKAEKADTEVFPLVNNFDPTTGQWLASVENFLNNPAGRANFRRQVMMFLASDKYKGLSLDLEEIPVSAQPGYRALIRDLYADLHAKGLKLYVNVPVDDNDYDYKLLSANTDGLILMNYDQHQLESEPGAVAGQDWFTHNLQLGLRDIPKEKIICAIGNYGYEWIRKGRSKAGKPTWEAHVVSDQDAWLKGRESEVATEFDADSLNPHIAFEEEDGKRHDIWFLDAVTSVNEMRAAHSLGINTFALWRLGSEDRSLWAIWDYPVKTDLSALNSVPPGQDVDREENGEILRITQRPKNGSRTLTLDPDSGLANNETMTAYPTPYQIVQYGAKEKKVAITFDDGPDPVYTPPILDVLKREQAPATFFLIGIQAEKYSAITDRIYNEGHEIGNHTFTHPDISNIPKRYMDLELNLTERLLGSELGIKPVYFRAPYSIDQEPDTADQVRPLEIVQDLGYITVGDKIDPSDWQNNPTKSAQQIINDTMANLNKGNIILLHDGGGNRDETVKALPGIIKELRARGYEIVPVSALLGKTRAEVMPLLTTNEKWWARINRFAFSLLNLLDNFIVLVFFVGDVLMSARLVFVGALAIYDRFRPERKFSREVPGFKPAVAVLVPAFNEEMVIERTVRSLLSSDYPNLRVIVIDDGSTDATYSIAKSAFAEEIKQGKVTVLTQVNSGKAEALNHALTEVTEEFFVGIDADTVIASNAISFLMPHFNDPGIAAVAGNTRVGNRVNLWTHWQALEYITSQNFERRALDVFGAVTVVPGAIGAWRTEFVRKGGGYNVDTVAEDADLTMNLLELGYQVIYEDRALAFTEAPTGAKALMRQRFRWSFGVLQSTWKHRGAFWRRGTLGWIALPNIAIFQILLPLVSPFIDIMFIIGAIRYAVDKHFHPDAASSASFLRLVFFFLAFMIIDFIASTIAFALERRQTGQKRDWWLLAHVWLQRFAYRQLFSLVLFRTLKRAADGRAFAWDKLERTAAMSHHSG